MARKPTYEELEKRVEGNLFSILNTKETVEKVQIAQFACFYAVKNQLLSAHTTPQNDGF
jgi:hypothetical protein